MQDVEAKNGWPTKHLYTECSADMLSTFFMFFVFYNLQKNIRGLEFSYILYYTYTDNKQK